jgi:hypothetical protein
MIRNKEIEKEFKKSVYKFVDDWLINHIQNRLDEEIKKICNEYNCPALSCRQCGLSILKITSKSIFTKNNKAGNPKKMVSTTKHPSRYQ